MLRLVWFFLYLLAEIATLFAHTASGGIAVEDNGTSWWLDLVVNPPRSELGADPRNERRPAFGRGA